MLVNLQAKKRTRREMMHQKYEYIQNIHRPRHCLMHRSDPSSLGTSFAQVMTRRHLCQKHRRWRPSVIEEVGKWLDKSSGLLGFRWQQNIGQKSHQVAQNRSVPGFQHVFNSLDRADLCHLEEFPTPKRLGKNGGKARKKLQKLCESFPLRLASWLLG